MASPLTKRENEVLKVVAKGFSNKEIAIKLSISESTVENHIHHIYEKLDISNRAQAVGFAYQSGIILVNEIPEN